MSKGIDGVTSSDRKGTCRVLGDTVLLATSPLAIIWLTERSKLVYGKIFD